MKLNYGGITYAAVFFILNNILFSTSCNVLPCL